jgi:hypothetical protein
MSVRAAWLRPGYAVNTLEAEFILVVLQLLTYRTDEHDGDEDNEVKLN